MKLRIVLFEICAFALTTFRADAQIDATINPVGLLFGGINVGADFVLSEDFSIEANVGYNAAKDKDRSQKYTGVPIQAVGKYYFNPADGADKFYAAAFVRYVNRSYTNDGSSSFADLTQSRLGAGVGLGFKAVSQKNIVFDFGINVGRVISDNTKYSDSNGTQEEVSIPGVIIAVKLGVGYRFGA